MSELKYGYGTDMPMGLSAALAKNPKAMQYFAGLSPEKQREVIGKTHMIGSKKQMQVFTDSLFTDIGAF